MNTNNNSGQGTVTRLLAAVVVLQGLVLVGQWTGGAGPVTPASAQIPDGGGQRKEMIDELHALNAKMDRVIDTLKSGEVQVKVLASDEKK